MIRLDDIFLLDNRFMLLRKGSYNLHNGHINGEWMEMLPPLLPFVEITADLQPFEATEDAPSDAQSYTISANNLYANIGVTAPQNYEVSLDGVAFAPSLSLTPVNGVITDRTIYVRLKNNVAGNHVGVINHRTTGYSEDVAVEGNVFIASPVILKVKTDNTGTSNDNQFRIPTHPSYTYDYKVERCDAAGNVLQTLENQTGDVTLTWDVAGTYLVKIYPKSDGSGFPAIYFNNSHDKDKLLDVTQWGSSVWQTMEYAFYGCSNFDSTATDAPNLSNVTDMRGMFFNCSNFNQSLSSWDVSSVTDMNSMFYGCSNFNQPLNSWDTSSVTSMYSMFYGCSNFNQDLSGWCVINIPTLPTFFDAGATAWVLPRPVWGTCPP